MPKRLDIYRQNKLEPVRIKKAVSELKKLGITPTDVDSKKVTFIFKGSPVNFFPYSGWASGKTIKDGRGLTNLLKQLV